MPARWTLRKVRSERGPAGARGGRPPGGNPCCALAHAQGLPHPRPPLSRAGGEIDLVAAWPFVGAPRLVTFVEVKQRRDESAFAEAIAPAQRRRIEAGGDAWLGANPKLAQALCRYDAVFVAPRRPRRHVKALWRRGE